MDELLTQCLDGDPRARNGFVDRYLRFIYAAVLRLVGGQTQVDAAVGPDDITQEVFVRLFRNDARLLRTYDPDRSAITTWLTIVARSTTLDVLRKKRLATVSFDPVVHSPAAPAEDPTADRPEIPPDLLSERQKLVLQMLFDREMPVPEVARVLGIEPQSVRSAKHKALTRLRSFFGADQK